MQVTTPYGVCYDLAKSPYTVRFSRWSFHFSTQRNADNFKNKAQGRIDWLNDSLTRRFHYVIEADSLALFQLYDQLEKRGLYVIDTTTGKVYDKGYPPRFMTEAW